MFALFNEKAAIPTPIVGLTRPTVAALWKTSRNGARLPPPERHAADILQRTKWDYSAEREDEGSLCQRWLPQTEDSTSAQCVQAKGCMMVVKWWKKKKEWSSLWNFRGFTFDGLVCNIWRFSRRNSNIRCWHIYSRLPELEMSLKPLILPQLSLPVNYGGPQASSAFFSSLVYWRRRLVTLNTQHNVTWVELSTPGFLRKVVGARWQLTGGKTLSNSIPIFAVLDNEMTCIVLCSKHFLYVFMTQCEANVESWIKPNFTCWL